MDLKKQVLFLTYRTPQQTLTCQIEHLTDHIWKYQNLQCNRQDYTLFCWYFYCSFVYKSMRIHGINWLQVGCDILRCNSEKQNILLEVFTKVRNVNQIHAIIFCMNNIQPILNHYSPCSCQTLLEDTPRSQESHLSQQWLLIMKFSLLTHCKIFVDCHWLIDKTPWTIDSLYF